MSGHDVAVANRTSRPRRPGRPPQTPEEQARARENILRATADVFAEHGYHGMKVAHVLERAGIARPTFYRYFRNADEVLELVLGRLGAELLRDTRRAIEEAGEDRDRVNAGIDAYLEWGRRHRRMLRALYAAVDDPVNPISAWRRAATEAFVQLIMRLSEDSGRPRPERWVLETYLNTIEFTSYRLSVEAPEDDQAYAAARIALRRIAVGLLGNRDDWRETLEMDELFPTSWPSAAGVPSEG